MSEELPEGWTEARLPQLADVIMGQSPPGSTYNETGNGLPFFQGKAEFGPRHPVARKWCSAPQRVAEPGDVLISVRAPVGPTNVASVRCAIGRGLSALRPRGGIPTEFVLFALRAQEQAIALQGTGSTFTAIKSSDLAAIELCVPPLPEQQRIVGRIEAVLAQVDAARVRLARVRLILKRFRQSVLAAACSGRLTEDWRTEDANVIPAAEIILKIANMRKQARSKTRNLDAAYEQPDGDLPESWVWCQLADITDVRLGGTPLRKVPTYWGGSVPWISSGEVANCRISEATECITEKALANSAAKVYPSGTVLIAMIGEGKTRGQCAILDIAAATNQNVAGLVFETDEVNPEYVWLWALSEYARTRLVGRGGNYPALNGRKVRALWVPLPPTAEQCEIVSRVHRLFSLANTIERRVAAASAGADALAQSTLAKAFRGELVPTEAERARADGRGYESGEALLARIRGERAAIAPPSKGQRGGALRAGARS